jgi:hypothetical protein
VWQPVGVTDWDSGWSKPTHVTTSARDSAADVAVAQRRAAASFGGGGATLAASVRNFVRRYGWRAYALPLLLVVTVVALVTTQSSNGTPAAKRTAAGHKNTPAAAPAVASHSSSPPVAPSSIPLKSDTPHGSLYQQVLKHAALPSGGSYTTTGDGTFRVLKGTTEPVGTGTLRRYDIEVENGITGVDLTAFADEVQSVLSDARSWSGHGVSLERVDSGPVDFHIGLTSSMTVRKLCGYTIPVETSCYAAADSVDGLTVNRVVIDVARWVRGDPAYVGDLDAYRIYMINHEDGHALGHEHAHECLSDGLAPVMMQQTFGLKSAATGKLCQANPWPYPAGASDAPGAEQPDTKANDEYYLINS